MFANLPPTPFLVFEFSIYVLLIIVSVHAWRRGRQWVIGLLASIVCALILENLAIRFNSLIGGYYYGRFLIMPFCSNTAPITETCSTVTPCIPLAVPMFEGMILYAAMRTSTKLGLDWRIAPLLDGLLALSLELSLDPIVSIGMQCVNSPSVPQSANPGLGFWFWQLTHMNEGVTQIPFFDVPLDNFKGWFVGIAAFSYALRIIWHYLKTAEKPILTQILQSVLAVFFGIAIVLGVAYAYSLTLRVIPSQEILMTIIIVGSIVTVWWFAKNLNLNNKIDLVELAIPTFFNLFLLYALLATGLHRSNPLLLADWLIFFVLSTALFTWPIWGRLNGRFRSA